MRAIASEAGIEALRLTELPEPQATAGTVRVRVTCSAVNPADYKVLGGEFAGKILHGGQRPLVVGYDVAGTVESLGEGVTDLAVGDEVFGFLPYVRATTRGAFAEQVVLPASALARRPAHLSPGQAAALATAGVTALQALRDHGGLKAGQQVLVVGASGGVGSVAVGVARAMGARVTGLCSESTFELVRSLGAERVIDYRQPDALAGEPTYDVIFDAAAMHGLRSLQHLLRPGGAYVTTLPSAALVVGKLTALFSGHRCAFISVNPNRADLEQLASWAPQLTLPIDSTWPVAKVGEAITRAQRGGMRGRIVVDVAGGFE